MIDQTQPIEVLAKRAAEVAELLKLLANEQRLLLLCRLTQGESSVSELVDLSHLAQSSVSQHLAKMRLSGIVATRRDGTAIYYRLADSNVEALIGMLCERFGPNMADSAD
ncbi:MAG TPA: metalloregulator ArsR/SmtB family transcription factor [Chakrabartia sp.]|jgi:DNA-binding transcriptional ArsR family regulator|nr:metalloregulator ArsR/SmtB family transcription factor [Chakrabartia sp.]